MTFINTAQRGHRKEESAGWTKHLLGCERNVDRRCNTQTQCHTITPKAKEASLSQSQRTRSNRTSATASTSSAASLSLPPSSPWVVQDHNLSLELVARVRPTGGLRAKKKKKRA